ncbi:hypothetical protein ACFWAT_20290 [Streptomyces syringium]|uniref:hypothetical protein n=1 Tax=Streptomyces syringium TaxID=76729 RepID=UPI003653A13E
MPVGFWYVGWQYSSRAPVIATASAIGSAAVLIALVLSPVSRLTGLPTAPEEPGTAAAAERAAV